MDSRPSSSANGKHSSEYISSPLWVSVLPCMEEGEAVSLLLCVLGYAMASVQCIQQISATPEALPFLGWFIKCFKNQNNSACSGGTCITVKYNFMDSLPGLSRPFPALAPCFINKLCPFSCEHLPLVFGSSQTTDIYV